MHPAGDRPRKLYKVSYYWTFIVKACLRSLVRTADELLRPSSTVALTGTNSQLVQKRAANV
ncbi:hypothetical protein M513_10717 [Trichuris suis]|uniref:Uncharacterized protein n=1 Tax=Trichuris suis TaxID=68888 RepID=A0A085LTX1_9BILA|nr:hypothetical protein M513_10717 [Trichuris suis]